MKASITIYGDFAPGHWWSRGVVSRGLALGLAANGIKVSVVNTGQDGRDSLCVPEGCTKHKLSNSTDIGLYVGGVGTEADHRVKMHPRTVGMLVTESEHLPIDLPLHLDYDLVVTPSCASALAYLRRGVEEARLMVVNHGLDEAYQEPGKYRPLQAQTRLLHFTGGPLDPLARKGTLQLLEAYHRVFAGKDAYLEIRAPKAHEKSIVKAYDEMFPNRKGRRHQVGIRAGDVPLSPQEMATLLKQEWSALVQPSTEGFGLLPLQARAVGLACIISGHGGHADHLERFDTLVPSGQTRVLTDTFSKTTYPLLAPEVTTEAVMSALQFFSKSELAARFVANAQAKGYYQRWAWPVVVRSLATRLNHMVAA
jgi:hypothetical protein